MKEQLIITIILLSLCLGLSGCTENNTIQEDNTTLTNETSFENTNISEDNNIFSDTADNPTENNTLEDTPPDNTSEEPDVPEELEDTEDDVPEEVEEPIEPEEANEPDEAEEYDISLKGPIEITNKDANGMNLHRRLLATFEVTSTFLETVSIGNYEVYLDGELISRVTPLNIKPGTHSFYVPLYQLEDHAPFNEIRIVFSCGTHVDESNCDNNNLTELVNYQ